MSDFRLGWPRVANTDDSGTPGPAPTPGQVLTVFHGLTATQTPNAAAVLAMIPSLQNTGIAPYEFQNCNGNYLCVAIPHSLIQPSAFLAPTLPTTYIHTTISLTIDAVATLYDLYISPFGTSAADITITAVP